MKDSYERALALLTECGVEMRPWKLCEDSEELLEIVNSGEYCLRVHFRDVEIDGVTFATVDDAIKTARKFIKAFDNPADKLWWVRVYTEHNGGYEETIFADWDACTAHERHTELRVYKKGLLVQHYDD